jgi:hypothetical protein
MPNVATDDCASVLARPEEEQISVRNQYGTRELRTASRSKSNNFRIVEILQDVGLRA